MGITKIALNSIASKMDVSKSENVSSTGAIDKNAKIEATKSAKVDFSDNAKIFTEAVDLVKRVPDVRLDRVAELKAAIASGTYKIDSVKIADRMLKSHILES